MKFMNKNKKGFTLVELMIVVVIMAILVAVAVPIYGAVTRNAKEKTCASHARNLSSQMNQVMMGTVDGSNPVSTLTTGILTTLSVVGDFNGGTSTVKIVSLLQDGLPVCPCKAGNTYQVARNGKVTCSGVGADGTHANFD
ncbi:MAG: Fimbrial protein precursor [Firmicutes bacterium ADurb.Bin300]|nr:MAG: Fimbrial protein precursor [Firmicutes bacterium ADurb.Bin300]